MNLLVHEWKRQGRVHLNGEGEGEKKRERERERPISRNSMLLQPLLYATNLLLPSVASFFRSGS